jgi:hypothetical protein
MADVVSPLAATKRLGLLQLVVLAAPLVWVVVALVHPSAEPYEGIADEANRWIFVHVIQLVLTPFVAAGVWLLMDGIDSVAASVTRAVLAFWMVFFSAFDAVAGIATGVLTRHANSLARSEKEGVGNRNRLPLGRQSPHRRFLRPGHPRPRQLDRACHRGDRGALPGGFSGRTRGWATVQECHI